MIAADETAPPAFWHGTRAQLNVGDLIVPGYRSNYGSRRRANFVYFAATLEAAIWGAELAQGEGQARIYTVAPTGPYEDDPNLTDKKFPGNPTRSYRTRAALLVTGEVAAWQGHAPEVLQAMQDGIEALRRQGIEAEDGHPDLA
jgi:Rifampin ADP-ribosyl transferase